MDGRLWGVHDSAGAGVPPRGMWDFWISEFKQMGLKWYKQCDNGGADYGDGTIFKWMLALRDAGITPVIRYQNPRMFPKRLEPSFWDKMVGIQYYHFYNRGNNRQAIFFERDNYLYFLRGVKKYLREYVEIMAYCLIPTHYHILARVRQASESQTSGVLKTSEVSRAMQKRHLLHQSHQQTFLACWRIVSGSVSR